LRISLFWSISPTILNTLNMGMQVENQYITDMSAKIDAFKNMLELWGDQLSHEDTAHFPELESNSNTVRCPVWKYAQIIKNVHEEFTRRFEDITKLRSTFDNFVKPFSVCAKRPTRIAVGTFTIYNLPAPGSVTGSITPKVSKSFTVFSPKKIFQDYTNMLQK
jgi:hypothetical protein